jgi:hypothetical protein
MQLSQNSHFERPRHNVTTRCRFWFCKQVCVGIAEGMTYLRREPEGHVDGAASRQRQDLHAHAAPAVRRKKWQQRKCHFKLRSSAMRHAVAQGAGQRATRQHGCTLKVFREHALLCCRQQGARHRTRCANAALQATWEEHSPPRGCRRPARQRRRPCCQFYAHTTCTAPQVDVRERACHLSPILPTSVHAASCRVVTFFPIATRAGCSVEQMWQSLTGLPKSGVNEDTACERQLIFRISHRYATATPPRALL